MKKIIVSTAVGFFLPLVTFAAAGDCSSISSYDGLTTCALYILNSFIPIIIALIVIWIIWSAFKFAKAEGEERSGYRDSMVWGIVGIFIAISIYGLVAILTNTFNTNTTTTITPVGVTANDIKTPN